MFDAKIFLENYGVDHTDNDPKHSRRGWVQIHCIFCSGNPGWHGGFCIAGGFYACWRCGGHSLYKVISTLLKTSPKETNEIIKKYSSGEPGPRFKNRKYADELELPSLMPLGPFARAYLENKNYDPDKLATIWNLKATDHIGPYAFRIFIPIFNKHKMVSFTTRAVQSGTKPKYKSCPEDNEIYHHKFLLYGQDQVPGDTCIVVEGPPDVWRLGPGAVGLFGIGFSEPQMQLLSQYKKVFIFFDPEEQAQIQAEKLYYQLTARGVECQILEDDKGKDPGELGQKEANQLMHDLL